MLKLMRLLSLTLMFSCGLAIEANARCSKPTSFLSDSQSAITSNYINFLICLHNEQQNSIRQQVEVIQELRSDIASLRGELYRVERKNEKEVKNLKYKIEAISE